MVRILDFHSGCLRKKTVICHNTIHYAATHYCSFIIWLKLDINPALIWLLHRTCIITVIKCNLLHSSVLFFNFFSKSWHFLCCMYVWCMETLCKLFLFIWHLLYLQKKLITNNSFQINKWGQLYSKLLETGKRISQM